MNSPVSTSDSEIDASVTFSEALMEQINREDVRNMVTAQRDMLCRFEKTNEMLINFNILSANRFAFANNELKEHTHLMYEMKKDLDSIFKRIRVLKDRLNKSYPDAFKVCNVSPLIEDEEEEELRVSTTSQSTDDQSVTNQTSDDQSGSSQVFDSQPNPRLFSEDQSSNSTNQIESNILERTDLSEGQSGSSQIEGENVEENVTKGAESQSKSSGGNEVEQEKLVDLD